MSAKFKIGDHVTAVQYSGCEGEIGIAQAASYACMRLYKSIGGLNK